MTRGRPRKYKTIEERRKANIDQKRKKIASMSPYARKAYYHELWIHSTRYKVLEQKRIQRAIRVLKDIGMIAEGMNI